MLADVFENFQNMYLEIYEIDPACYLTAAGRGGSRTVATSKMERFGIIVNGFQPLTIITKRSILDVAAVLDPPQGGLALMVEQGNRGGICHTIHRY